MPLGTEINIFHIINLPFALGFSRNLKQQAWGNFMVTCINACDSHHNAYQWMKTLYKLFQDIINYMNI